MVPIELVMIAPKSCETLSLHTPEYTLDGLQSCRKHVCCLLGLMWIEVTYNGYPLPHLDLICVHNTSIIQSQRTFPMEMWHLYLHHVG